MARYHYTNTKKNAIKIVKRFQDKGFSATYREVSGLGAKERARAKGKKYEVRVTR